MSDSIANALNRIEGQVRGVKRMYEERRDCEQIAQQIAAIQKGLTQVGKKLLTDEAVCCMDKPDSKKNLERVLDNLVKIA